jgi:hypothetical protein
MTVYVDELVKYPTKLVIFGDGSCHMMADMEEELHEFALKLKMLRNWFHRDHYDLTPAKRALAIRLGAIQITTREMVRTRSHLKKQWLQQGFKP